MEEARERRDLPNYSRRLEVRKAGRTSRSWAPGVNRGQEAAGPWTSQLAALPTHPTNTQSFFFLACQILVQPQFKSIYTRLSYSRAQMLAHTVC